MFNFIQSEVSEAVTRLLTRFLSSQGVDVLCLEMEAVVMKSSASKCCDMDQHHNLCVNIMKKISDLKALRPISVDKDIQKMHGLEIA